MKEYVGMDVYRIDPVTKWILLGSWILSIVQYYEN
jgi:hypothetical protein